MKRCWLLYFLFLLYSARAAAQMACPDNINFEQGTLANWECATSTNTGTGIYTWTPVAPVAGRQTILSGSGTDAYGGFPVVAPGGGQYSAMLGNSSPNRKMDRIRYTLHVPPSAGLYSLIYRYAVVFQDGGHSSLEQPFFRVKASDSATGQTLACNDNTYISTSSLPGFLQPGGTGIIWYKDWTAATMRLNGVPGHTVYIEFTTSDCSMGGHFGYAYVDLDCNGYAVTSANCNGASATPLTGPPGFSRYDWYDSTFSTHVGSGQTVYIPSPAPSNYYQVVVTPYTGFGCVDTLGTRITYSTLVARASPDTTYLCGGNNSARLIADATGSMPPFTYSWTPVSTLSCVYCNNPTATPTVSTAYVVSVTDSVGCRVTDTAFVNAGVLVSTSQQNVTCFGQANGVAAALVSGGRPPYTYSWSTTPARNTATINGLGPGTYRVTVTDANGCAGNSLVIITQPAALGAAISAYSNITCFGGHDGAVAVSASGGTPPYTYSWNTSPVQTTASITSLAAGTYTCTVQDASGCTKSISKTLDQPAQLTAVLKVLKKPCAGLSEGVIAVRANGGTAPYQYRWVGIQGNADTVRNLRAGLYYINIYDGNGCVHGDSIRLAENPLPQVQAGADGDLCVGDSMALTANGAATYQWAPSGYLSCDTCARTTATPDSSVTYYLAGTDANGCVNHDTINISVLQHVAVSIDSTRHLCPGGYVVLSASGGEAYQWTPAKTLSSDNVPNPTARPDTTQTYQVIIRENRCFSDTLTQQVIVLPKPSIQLGADFKGIPGATATLETQVAGAERIAWTPPAGLSCDDCFAPVASLDTSITYTAEVTNSYGCTAADTIRIQVACDGTAIYTANTFTPNHDGQNDYFYPQGLGINSVKRFMIYDRWGEIVFRAENIPANVPERGWDGTFKNKELPPDVFLFVIETICKDGSPIVLKGDVTLVR